MVSSFSVEDATRSARMVVALGHFTEISVAEWLLAQAQQG